ncbi:glycerate kinase [Kibdelosporangium banguiense]|uniref:Glycerate kinase n=1 Tax=Kibdelosporangium banguiense TaxID=1365924 RepID=A0ABS4TJ24_9PSEU|nr:glycerate kinase [Kibdelosporangium banguiense]MBP2324423.1 glycerate kinase [Kibdelosporangium banguiense]
MKRASSGTHRTLVGAVILGESGDPVNPGGAGLAPVKSIDIAGMHQGLAEAEVLLAVNPHNVLCGPNGVARVFGPQKGATPEQVSVLSDALERWAVGRCRASAPAHAGRQSNHQVG